MRERVRQAIKHPLISGSAVVFLGSLIGSFFNFLFHLFMSRNLSLSDFGILASLISLTTLPGFVSAWIAPTMVNFAATYFAKEDLGGVKNLFIKVGKLTFFLGFLLFVIFFLFRGEIGSFFKIDDESLIVLAGFTILCSSLGVVITPLLQAKLAFKTISFMNFFIGFFKVILGVVLVFLGFRVVGAMWAFFLSSVIPYLLAFVPLRFVFQKTKSDSTTSMKRIFTYGSPAAFITFGVMAFITTDIILVKHFFDPQQAGIYATISLIGKVIFYFSAPIGTVMFPLITQKFTRGEDYHKDFKVALLLVLLPSIAMAIFYFLFPEFVVKIFRKDNISLLAADYIGLFGILMTVYTALSLITNFYLSVSRTEIYIPIVIGVLAQGLLLWFYHSSFLEVITISLTVTSLLLFSLLIYYFKLYARKKSK